MNPIQFIDQHQDLLLNTYRDLHALAEPSWKEEKTSLYIENRLKQAGLHVKRFPTHFGIIAEIPGELTKVVALRADLDAIVQEVDGIIQPNHSCGHDGHSTMVLYTALAIAASGIKPKYTLRFIFQPAEEKGEGARQMMKDGALENTFFLFGIHVRPRFEVPYKKASPVINHGSVGTIKGEIKGIQAHAARPQDGINAIEVASLLVKKTKQIKLNTNVPYSVKMTQLQIENEASNVIPETAEFTLDMRAQSNEIMREIRHKIDLVIEKVIEQTGAIINWSMDDLVPAAIRNERAIKLANIAIGEILGKENILPECISQGAEDFHFYTQQNPDLAATMVGLGTDLSPGLHHPQMRFKLDALIYGTKILTKTMLLACEE